VQQPAYLFPVEAQAVRVPFLRARLEEEINGIGGVMRIYKINVESVEHGCNFRTEKIAAKTFKEAVRKAEKLLYSNERIESIELIASTD
jgi:hypothetical protein